MPGSVSRPARTCARWLQYRSGVTFAVEVEEVPVASLLGGVSARRAVGFWIDPARLETTVAALSKGGHVRGLVDPSGG